MKQVDLVKLTNISKNAISNYVKGIRTPDTLSIYKISKALNVSIEWLLTGEGMHTIENSSDSAADVAVMTVSEENTKGYTFESKDQPGHQKFHQAAIVLTDEELDIIVKYRQLDSRDQEDTRIGINIRFERTVKKGRSSGSTTGGSGEEAAISDIA